ncbi:MAG: HAD-IIIC family phosphatase, partial [Desulfovibrionaceae bacterium]
MSTARPFFRPLPPHELVLRRRALIEELAQAPGLLEKRIAILGGSTTAELRSLLELFLLDCGIRPMFYESGYDRFYEEAAFSNPELERFRPDVAYIHTTVRNIPEFPAPRDTPEAVAALADAVCSRFGRVWSGLVERYGCAVVQNNFDPPPLRPLGNLDAAAPCGATRLVRALNERFAQAAARTPGLVIHDIDRLAAEAGLDAWHDSASWFAYKCAPGLASLPVLARSVAGLLRAMFGKASKCLALDLDNTLWGGVVGDDGPEGIRLGRESAEGEAYVAFQQYVKALKARGVILAVCSKNEQASALEGLNHPDSVLRPDDFALILANWEPKSRNLAVLAEALNIGLDSVVFFDDNPAERELVRRDLPEVAVPEPGPDVAGYAAALDRSRLFEVVGLSAEDLERNAYYAANARRRALAAEAGDYGDYLRSLEMEAEIGPFTPQYLERITQLTNKTNQFNLTTRRYTRLEIEAAAASDRAITVCARLRDRFGD